MRPDDVPPPESFSCLPRIWLKFEPVPEEARLGFDQVVDRHEVVFGGLDEARRALRARVRVRRLGDGALLEVPRPVSARALDAVLMKEAEVEPNGGVERAVLVHEEERQLGFERVGVGLAGEVAAELVARDADRVREAMHDLADARLALVFVATDSRLAEVLRDDDVRRELTPRRGDLGAFHLEDDRPVGVRDHARAALVDDAVEGVHGRRREAALDARAALTRALPARALRRRAALLRRARLGAGGHP
jgi:hypothetical protein